MGGEDDYRIESEGRSESIPLQPVASAEADELDGQHDKRFLDRAKEDWRRVATLVCLWLAYLVCNIAFSLLSPFFPEEAKKKGFGSMWTGVIVGCASLTVVFVSPIVGYVLPYFGAKCVTTSGLLLIGGAYILLGFADLLPSNWIFVLYTSTLRMVEGLGTGAFSTATLALAADLFPESIGTTMGLLQISAGLGYALGPTLGGLLYQLGGFKLPFLSVGVLVSVFTLPCALLVKGNRASKPKAASIKVTSVIFTDFIFVLLVLANILGYADNSFFYPVFQSFLSEQFHLEPLQVGLVFFGLAAIYLISAFFIGPLTDRLGHRWFIVFGLMGTSLTLFLVGPAEFITTPTLWLTGLAYVSCGVPLASILVPISADLLATAKKKVEGISKGDVTEVTAVVSGVVASSMSLGQFLGPVIAGVLGEFFSFPTSAVLLSEVIMAEGFALMGATLIEKYTRTP